MYQTLINIGSLQQPRFQVEPNLRKQAKKKHALRSALFCLYAIFFFLLIRTIHMYPYGQLVGKNVMAIGQG